MTTTMTKNSLLFANQIQKFLNYRKFSANWSPICRRLSTRESKNRNDCRESNEQMIGSTVSSPNCWKTTGFTVCSTYCGYVSTDNNFRALTASAKHSSPALTSRVANRTETDIITSNELWSVKELLLRVQTMNLSIVCNNSFPIVCHAKSPMTKPMLEIVIFKCNYPHGKILNFTLFWARLENHYGVSERQFSIFVIFFEQFSDKKNLSSLFYLII